MASEEIDNLFTAGLSFAIAVETLLKEVDKRPGLILPIVFLTGFAFELSLKAAVLAGGAQPDVVKVIGHDLHKAMLLAKEAGYIVPINQGIEEMLTGIADAHKSNKYRYIGTTTSLPTPKPPALAKALKAHMTAIAQQFAVWDNTGSPSGR